MHGGTAIGAWRRKITGLFGACVATTLLLISDQAGAGVHIRSESKVLILSGYSADLTKRELPAINERLGFLLQGLSEGLEAMFDANIETLSERDLNARLDLLRLEKGSPAGIRDFLRIEKYSHLIVADVQMKGENRGSASIRVESLSPDGSTIESGATPKIALTAKQTDSDLNNLRQVVLRDFAKFRPPDAPKRVTIECILPRNSIVVDTFTNQLQLERVLSEPITLQLIEIHHSPKIKDMGYLPIVHHKYWQFESSDNGKTIRCKPATSAAPDSEIVNVSIKQPDYTIDGRVGVTETNTGLDKVHLNIRVVRHLPSECKTPPIEIDHPFNPNRYDGNGKVDLSWQFSKTILPSQYVKKWIANIGACSP
jgi:hypothetical protein